MKAHRTIRLFVAAAVVAPALALGAPAPEERAAQGTNSGPQSETRSSEAVKPASGGDKAARQNQQAAAPAPAGIGEILKMLDAGVSSEVIKVYIENSAMAYHLSAGDVIGLKEHGATDDLTTALLKRGAEIRARGEASPGVAAPVFAGAQPGPFHLDPEGYDYFQYYYLYPRTLASAYERLGFYGPPPYGYGYYPAYGASFSFGYGYPRRLGFRGTFRGPFPR